MAVMAQPKFSQPHGLYDVNSLTVAMIGSDADAVIRYTTDGSEPKENGGIYNTEFRLPDGSKFVRYAVMYGDCVIEEKSFSVDTTQKEKKINIDPKKWVTLKFRKTKSFDDTASSYKELSDLERLDNVLIKGSSVYIEDKNNRDLYIEFTSGVPCWAGNLKKVIDSIRTINFSENSDVTVTFSYDALLFTSGELFLQWVDLNKYDVNELARNGEISGRSVKSICFTPLKTTVLLTFALSVTYSLT